MASGGKRKGAGRPRGRAVSHQIRISDWAAKFIRSFAAGSGMSLTGSVDTLLGMASRHWWRRRCAAETSRQSR